MGNTTPTELEDDDGVGGQVQRRTRGFSDTTHGVEQALGVIVRRDRTRPAAIHATNSVKSWHK